MHDASIQITILSDKWFELFYPKIELRAIWQTDTNDSWKEKGI